ncbi:hypothetical protein [Synechococcus sp. MIT S1220]|uniref:hypothetical protein n=1 Tax=Synechococcus sp. MIT S1220 TaxID=3082549 RepID=UPI0039B0ACB5
MRILLAIVHYWNPEGGGDHQSLRPEPEPRVEALQRLILAVRRLAHQQLQLHIAGRRADGCNEQLRHSVDLCLITDGQHHVLDYLDESYHGMFKFVITHPVTPKHLGFEAHRFLAAQVDSGYDLLGYMEDDLVIHDSLFFHKIYDFQCEFGVDHVLLPQRVELVSRPDPNADRFYIDGPLVEDEWRRVIPNPPPELRWQTIGGDVLFVSPENPHAGCFFLTPAQWKIWMACPWWQNGDDRWITPLESAATVGIARTFCLYKPAMSHASWLEIQHWGEWFHCKLTLPSVAPSSAPTENELLEQAEDVGAAE